MQETIILRLINKLTLLVNLCNELAYHYNVILADFKSFLSASS